MKDLLGAGILRRTSCASSSEPCSMFVYHSQWNSGGAEPRALKCCGRKAQCPFLQDKLTRQNRPGAERDLGDHLICPPYCQQGIPRPTGLNNLEKSGKESAGVWFLFQSSFPYAGVSKMQTNHQPENLNAKEKSFWNILELHLSITDYNQRAGRLLLK